MHGCTDACACTCGVRAQVMRQHETAGRLKWPPCEFQHKYAPPSSIHLPAALPAYLQGRAPPSALPPSMRGWLALRGADTCGARALRVAGSVDAVDVTAFTSTPLQVHVHVHVCKPHELTPAPLLQACACICIHVHVHVQAGMKLEALVVQRTRTQRGLEPLPTELPFKLDKHPAAQSELAAEMLRRLQADVAHCAHEQAHIHIYT